MCPAWACPRLGATILDHLADTQHTAGNQDTARTSWQHALTILDQLQPPDADSVRLKLNQTA